MEHAITLTERPGPPSPEEVTLRFSEQGVAELAALVSPEVRSVVERRGIELVNFRQLTP